MSNSKKTTIISSLSFPLFFSLFVTAWLVFIGSPNICAAQDEEAKSIQSEELIKKRPAVKVSLRRNKETGAANAGKPLKTGAAKKRFYRVVKSVKVRQATGSPTKVAPRKTEEALLGLTVWKLRPAGKNDAAKEMIEEEQSGQTRSSEYTLERMETDAPLTIGERIRLSVESLSHSGYLYVVERELYSDGTYSAPKLIYPTLRTVNRKNPIGAGNLIFIPEAPRYFRIKSLQTEKKQTAEALTIIVSPTALIDQSMLQTKALDLPVEQFTGWLKNWEVDTTLLEQVDGAGQAITPVEQSAGQDSAKALTEESVNLAADDPIPQSVFRSKINRGNPVLINVLLEFRAN